MNKNNMPKWLFILLIPILIIFLIGFIFIERSRNDNAILTNQPTTSNNNGLNLPTVNTTGSSLLNVPQLISTSEPQITPNNQNNGNVSETNFFNTYELITSRVIDAVKDAIALMQWVMLAFIGIVGSVIAYLIATIKTTDESLRENDKKIVEARRDFDAANKQFELSQESVKHLTNSFYSLQAELDNFQQSILPYDFAAKAFEKGSISSEEFAESQQWYSWQKWLFGEDITGFEELLAIEEYGNGLTFRIKRAIFSELNSLDTAKKRRGFLSKDESEFQFRLMRLLGFEKKTD